VPGPEPVAVGSLLCLAGQRFLSDPWDRHPVGAHADRRRGSGGAQGGGVRASEEEGDENRGRGGNRESSNTHQNGNGYVWNGYICVAQKVCCEMVGKYTCEVLSEWQLFVTLEI